MHEFRPDPAETRETARNALVLQLERAKTAEDRARREAEHLRFVLRAAKAGGLAVTQLAQLSGLTRAGVYDVLSRASDVDPDPDAADDAILAVVAAQGAATRDSVNSELKLRPDHFDAAIQRLLEANALVEASAGYDRSSQVPVLLATSAGKAHLDAQVDRAGLLHRNTWAAYFRVAESQADDLHAAARQRFSGRAALLPASTASAMRGPELALGLPGPDHVSAINQAGRAWVDLRDDADLPPEPIDLADLIPPSGHSQVLDAFIGGLFDADPGLRQPVAEASGRAVRAGQDRDLAIRALTEAATTLRRVLGQPRPARLLCTGDDAFDEWQAVQTLRLDARQQRIQDSLLRALDRATDRIGPLPGGRLGSLRAPGAPPAIVEDVEPTPDDLEFIARYSGEAIGRAYSYNNDLVDPERLIEVVVEGLGIG